MNVGHFSNQYCYFFDDAEFHDTDRAGFRRRIITGEYLQLCFWRIAGGATGSFMHQHEAHEQLGIIMRGGLDFRIGEPDTDQRTVLREGDVYLAPTSIWHGDSIFLGDDEYGECWILDIFAPPRPDFLAAEVAARRATSSSAANGSTS